MMNKNRRECVKVTDLNKLDIEITPEEMEELLRDLPVILQELNENVVKEKVS
ncbi:hypothetical protein SOV_12220 [Sporomusa ovata DSM 2662]|uniref:Uncharacterized protein n=1 Tax=Sporomusa ovata TaxID=2378 RepID=A0A0U1KXV7_9FIRM|nr:hypothetical protein [Sporomusa ovata]EQB28835.1 hypothetical protein SOV_1c05610 [Sporomusa ovata DSM 2662]CQR72258.1 hypothetical protein SpAn4DRAFT_2718 [Sporomusa ovata]